MPVLFGLGDANESSGPIGHYTPQSKCEAAAGAQPFWKFVTVMHSSDSSDSV